MKIWVDAQLSPQIAAWIVAEFSYEAFSVKELGLRDAEDREIFAAAKEADVVVMTKDRDFLLLLDSFGPPPRIIWLTCGNTSNASLKEILKETLVEAIRFLESGEAVVEINSP